MTDKLFQVALKLRLVDLNYNFKCGLVDLNYNFECDWLTELSDNKLPDTTWQMNYWKIGVFKQITIEEIVIFMITITTITITITITMKVKNDHRSEFSYLSTWKEEA